MMLLLLLSPFVFHDLSPSTIELRENGKPVFAYNHGMMEKSGRRRSSYLHPVYAPDGTVVTDDFPKDHLHHRGISWMWPVVRVDGSTYDLWMGKGIQTRFVRWIAREARADSARLAVENGWFVGGRKVVKETVEIVARPGHVIDLALTFEAVDGPVEIAGTPDRNKGYGGLSFRFAPREGTVIRTDTGVEARDSDMAPHRWAELEGSFGGKRAGARVELDKPEGWCLRHYGFLGVNYPGLQPVTLAPGKPLALKYRIRIYN